MKEAPPRLPGTPLRLFRNRREAGRILAAMLGAYRRRGDVVVLGLAGGGLPVASEVAAALGAPLDAFVVRTLGAPGHDEFAIGALAGDNHIVINDDMVRAFRVTPQQLREVAEREGRELISRELAYREGRPPVDITGKTVILVDDGLATGAGMRAAVQALREAQPAEIVIAVPAAPASTCREFAGIVDEVVCATMPTPFLAVGDSFWDFAHVTDQEMRELLARATTTRPPPRVEEPAADVIDRAAVGAPDGVPPRAALADVIGDARIVLIGESSHGTREFHQARSEITTWLIEEKGFCAVAVEADWPAAYRVNRYVRGIGDDATSEEALRGFERFPAWPWRNVVVRDFVDWLRRHNDRASATGQRPVGFYGLDLYSQHRSMREVIAYLDIVDQVAAARARQRYAHFDHLADDDGRAYGFAAAFGAGVSHEREAVEQLVEMQRDALRYTRRDGLLGEDEVFYAQQNAQTMRNAEVYYRAMFADRVTSWNLRDAHMAHTLTSLLAHLSRYREAESPRVVVWAHNLHVGDGRATEIGAGGQLTLGQLVRERYADDCRLIGFSTYTGTVTAASEWGGVAERKTVRPTLKGSVEGLFHEASRTAFMLPMQAPAATNTLDFPRLGRAIGVIYQPKTERQSHCCYVRPTEQFDVMIHIDQTTALQPLQLTSVDHRRNA